MDYSETGGDDVEEGEVVEGEEQEDSLEDSGVWSPEADRTSRSRREENSKRGKVSVSVSGPVRKKMRVEEEDEGVSSCILM